MALSKRYVPSKRYLAFFSLVPFFFAACGGDSSISKSSDENISSSEEAESSSSVVKSSSDKESSSDVKSSSDKGSTEKSSSDKASSGKSSSDKSSSSTNKSSSSTAKSSDSEGTPDIESSAEIWTIQGVAQKGPYLRGSKVTAWELTNASNLERVGDSVESTIDNNEGKYKIALESMANPYAELRVEGNFRNEVSSENSKNPLALYALTKLKGRDVEGVNINLLTHLEYYRVAQLVEKENLDIEKAKKKAREEILKAFYIENDIGNFEDLNIFAENDGAAALLAINVLMLQDLYDAEFSKLLTAVVSDIEGDGRWDGRQSDSLKTKIADWAYSKDVSKTGYYDVISNIEYWGTGKAPLFIKYVRNFWSAVYGLSECTKDQVGKLLESKNHLSKYYGSKDRFVCHYNDSNKVYWWYKATDTEKDVYRAGNIKGEDGELRKGKETKNVYKFDEAYAEQTGEDLSGWKLATVEDTVFRVGCTEKRNGEVLQKPIGTPLLGDFYMCSKESSGNAAWAWTVIDLKVADTYGHKCTANEIGDIVGGYFNKTYTYYCSKDGWLYYSMLWEFGIPKELRFNQKMEYDEMTDSRDKKKYKIVTIGEGEDAQIWMAENLNYYGKDSATLKNSSWCYYDESSYCDEVGRLYTWAAAIDSAKLYDDKGIDCGFGKTCELPDTVQGVCPPDWHLPSKAEWELLFKNVGGQSQVATMLRSQTGWDLVSHGSLAAEDPYGFSALPVVYRDNLGHFAFPGNTAYFWSATEYTVNGTPDEESAYFVNLEYYNDKANLNANLTKNFAFPVRCIHN